MSDTAGATVDAVVAGGSVGVVVDVVDVVVVVVVVVEVGGADGTDVPASTSGAVATPTDGSPPHAASPTIASNGSAGRMDLRRPPDRIGSRLRRRGCARVRARADCVTARR
jgi:hypothetical protein